MEFRIAPLIMAFFNLFFILFVNPDINQAITLSSVANLSKILIPFLLIFLLSVGAFARHSYYTLPFKATFYVVQFLNIALAVYFVYVIRMQHLS